MITLYMYPNDKSYPYSLKFCKNKMSYTNKQCTNNLRFTTPNPTIT